MQIKEITDKDIPDVAQAMASAYGEEPWNENWRPDKAERRIRAILHNYGALGYMAQENQEVLGAVLGYVDPYAEEDFFYISELFVKAGRKRNGIGTKLLARLEERLALQRIRVIQLMSIQDNIPFYERNKMIQDSVIVMYKRMD